MATIAHQTRKIEVLLPSSESVRHETSHLVARVDSLRGKTIGFANNTWHCMNVIVDEYREVLINDYGVRDVVVHSVPQTVGLTEEMMADIVKRCDAVIVGIGN